jgi:hypothetical protein
MILDKSVLVANLNPDANNADKEGYTTYSGFALGAYVTMNIQPASAEFTMMSDGQPFKMYRAFTLASGVIENMKLTVSGTSDTYYVRGREVYDFGMGQHYELTLEKRTR